MTLNQLKRGRERSTSTLWNMGREVNGIRGMEKRTAIPHRRREETPDGKKKQKHPTFSVQEVVKEKKAH